MQIELTDDEVAVVKDAVTRRIEDLDWAMPADDGPVGDEIRALEAAAAKLDA